MTSNIAGKSMGSAIKSLLTSEYKFMGGDKVQEMFVTDVQKLFKEYNRDGNIVNDSIPSSINITDWKVIWWNSIPSHIVSNTVNFKTRCWWQGKKVSGS